MYNALSLLDDSKAPGCDNINPYILRNCSDALKSSLTHLSQPFHLIWSQLNGKCIKYALSIKRVTTLRQAITDLSLCCYIKCWKKLSIGKSYHLFTLKYPNQFGFMKNRSCLSQLLTSYTEIYKSINTNQHSDIVFLDFSKAFDSVPHAELLYKLWMIGITGSLWLWFKNYLSK